MVRLTLSAVALFVIASLFSSCSATPSEHLGQYRDGAVRHLVASQTGRSVEEIGRDYPKTVILQPLVHFQVDSVDRSQVTFRITGEKGTRELASTFVESTAENCLLTPSTAKARWPMN
jgi:hypothetical protein